MRLIETMSEQIRERIRTWLRIQPATGGIVDIHEALDFYGNAIRTECGTGEKVKNFPSCTHSLMETGQGSGRQVPLWEWKSGNCMSESRH